MHPADDELHFEILKSERLRVRALIAVLGGLFLLALLTQALPREWNPLLPAFGERFPYRAVAVFYGAACLYELFAHAVLHHAITHRRRLPEPPRYVNALIETSFPTVMMWFFARSVGPEIPLNSPLPMLYFVFLSLSTLRLGAGLALFTGAVAAVELAALGIYFLGGEAGGEGFFGSPLPIVMKAVALLVTGGACAFVATQIRGQLSASLRTADEKNRVIGMFGQYVSPAVVDQLLARPLDERGDERHVTIMFLDIRGFTTFAERRAPQEVLDYLNTLFAMMIGVVNANHGIINKFLGDGFMACFGAPLSTGEDTRNAVRAAMEIAATIDRMNADGAIAPTRIGIGLHAGTAVTGSVGSNERREYTLIGDTVNLASRVEQLTKNHGCVLLVTEPVWQVVRTEYPGRPLEPVIVKGREAPVAIYALR